MPAHVRTVRVKLPNTSGGLNHDKPRTLNCHGSGSQDSEDRNCSYAEITAANGASTTPSGQRHLVHKASLSKPPDRTYKREFCDQNQVEYPHLGAQHDAKMWQNQIKQRAQLTSELKSEDVCHANANDDHEESCYSDSLDYEGDDERDKEVLIGEEEAATSHLYSQGNGSRTHRMQGRLSKSPDNRGLRASETLLADPSYEKDVGINASKVRCCIQKPLAVKDLQEKGIVYALRDEDLGLVKIGSTRRSLRIRKEEVESRCKSFSKLTVIGRVVVPAYKRLESIIQQDLTPHRWFFHCECGKSTDKGYTRHHQWFELEDDVVLKTLNFWASFVKDNPWVQYPLTNPELSLGEKTCLKPEWLSKLNAPQTIHISEGHDCHEARLQRWHDLLRSIDTEVGEVKVNDPTAATAVEGHSTGTGTNTDSSPDESPSKSPIRSIEEPVGADEPSEIHKQSSDPLKRSPLRDHAKSGARTSNSTVSDFQPVQGISLPLRGKQTASDPNFPRDAVKTPDDTSVEADSFGAILPRPAVDGSRPRPAHQHHHTFGSFDCNGKNHDISSSEFKPARLGSELVPAAIIQQPAAGGAPQWALPFATIWSLPSVNSSPQPQSQQTHAPESENLNEKLESQQDHGSNKVSQPQTPAQPINSEIHICNQTLGETTFSPDYLLPSLLALTTKLLAKKTRPLPASTISVDLWQLRWPLACFVVSALHFHTSPALSFVIWIVFLPCFVAELRGWTGSEQL